MLGDLRSLYEDWALRNQNGSVRDFADFFFQRTNVSLGSVLSEEEKVQLVQWFGGDEGMLEGIDSGP